MGIFRSIVSRFAAKVLDIDDTAVPEEQLAALRDFLSHYRFDLRAKDIKKLLEILKKKHMVDSITVSKGNGELVASSEGNGNLDAATASQLHGFVRNQMSAPESMLLKTNSDWFMVLPFSNKLYVIKAKSSLSNIELKALAREVENFLKKHNNSRKAY